VNLVPSAKDLHQSFSKLFLHHPHNFRFRYSVDVTKTVSLQHDDEDTTWLHGALLPSYWLCRSFLVLCTSWIGRLRSCSLLNSRYPWCAVSGHVCVHNFNLRRLLSCRSSNAYTNECYSLLHHDDSNHLQNCSRR
jgi:hypothetical protein